MFSNIFKKKDVSYTHTTSSMSQHYIAHTRSAFASAQASAQAYSETIASAQAAPIYGMNVQEQRKTAEIVGENYDGGVSFSLPETFRQAVKNGIHDVAIETAITIIERLSIFGTSTTRVDINATSMTADSRKLFYEIAAYDIDLILNILKSVYDDARAPKNTHLVYLIALLTSASQSVEDGVTEQQAVTYRTKGYSFVHLWRIPTHFIEWVNIHLNLCSLARTAIGTSNEVAPTVEQKESAISNQGRYSKSSRSKSKHSKVTIPRSGGTGTGFRNACKAWYMKYCSSITCASNLAFHICKKNSHEGTTHKDILAMIHIEMTTKKKCTCKNKEVCKCPDVPPHLYSNLIPVACQISLAYAVKGINHAVKILIEGIDRLTYNGGDPVSSPDIREAFNVLAFLCAVTIAKDERTPSEELCNLIRLFRLTREMVSNTKLNSVDVLCELLLKKSYSPEELQNKRRDLLLEKIPLHTVVTSIYPEVEVPEKTDDKDYRIGMPITALIRNLNRFTYSDIFGSNNYTSADKIMNAITKNITDKDVLQKGMVHPVTLFSAWATYSQGQGILGSKNWTPDKSIVTALINSVELAFKGLTGFDATCAFCVDASGSMNSAGSAPGVPGARAIDIATILTLSFYRATLAFSEANNKPWPNHIVGYFGNKKAPVMNTITMDTSDMSVIRARASEFKDVSNVFTFDTTFAEAKNVFGNGAHMGYTDIASSLWYLVATLRESLEKVSSADPKYQDIPLFCLPGYVDLIMFVTDNDVNSGEQPSDVLKIYRKTVYEGFKLIPINKDGARVDPEVLARQHIPKLVVVSTMGGDFTVGDPRDPNTLNVSGFDSATPAIINAFLGVGTSVKLKDENDDAEQ